MENSGGAVFPENGPLSIAWHARQFPIFLSKVNLLPAATLCSSTPPAQTLVQSNNTINKKTDLSRLIYISLTQHVVYCRLH